MFKCIVIDDELWARKIIKNFGKWKELHIEIVGEGENGEDALRLIEQYEPDIVITDMDMGVMNGVELLKKIANQYRKIKVIVISGYDNFNYAQQAIRSNAVEYILKPIDGEELNGALMKCINKLAQDRQLSVASFYDLGDESVVKDLMGSIARLKEAVRGIDSVVIRESIADIHHNLLQFGESEDILTVLLDEHISSIIRDGLMDVIKRDEVMANLYRSFRNQIKENLELENYLHTLEELIMRGMASRVSWRYEKEKPIAMLAKEYIDEFYRENIHLSDVSEHFFVSKEYMSQTFKQTYDITMGNYILSKKMEEAVRLIKAGEKYNKIAEKLNYSDVNYFYKVFKKYYAKSPGEFLK